MMMRPQFTRLLNKPPESTKIDSKKKKKKKGVKSTRVDDGLG